MLAIALPTFDSSKLPGSGLLLAPLAQTVQIRSRSVASCFSQPLADFSHRLVWIELLTAPRINLAQTVQIRSRCVASRFSQPLADFSHKLVRIELLTAPRLNSDLRRSSEMNAPGVRGLLGGGASPGEAPSIGQAEDSRGKRSHSAKLE